MIDIEAQVFTIVSNAVLAEYPDAFVSPEYVRQPAQFPTASIVQTDNTVNRSMRDSSRVENGADVMFQVDVYSNKMAGRKEECKAVIALIDEQFALLGFTRSFLNPLPNLADATIYRITARYIATVDKNETIYRR